MIDDHIFRQIISLENLLKAWREFRRGKTNKKDVQQFEFFLEANLFKIHQDLKKKRYQPQPYQSFYICDPKSRHIHKASVRDRVIHQAVFRVLYPIFDKSFIADSYSCRFGKGTHRGVKKLENFVRKISRNFYQSVFALKIDVKKFFHHIDHQILFTVIQEKIKDQSALWLIKKIIESFESESSRGLPLGNVTSQLFANIYLDKLDQFIKHDLRENYYLRYCDDLIILSSDRNHCFKIIQLIRKFLLDKLKLEIHQDKLLIRKLSQGIDFLGYVVLPHYQLVRTNTKKRIFRKINNRLEEYNSGATNQNSFNQTLQSYLGVLSHAKTYKLRQKIYSSLSELSLGFFHEA